MKKTLTLLLVTIALVACRRAEKPQALGYDKTSSDKPPTAFEKVKPEPIPPQGELGEMMPDYSAPLLGGGTFDAKAERGKPVLLNLWATWCGPCRAEMPELVVLHGKYAARGLQIVGVSLDDAASEAAVRGFVKEQKVQYRIVLDPDGKLANLFQASVIPTTVLLDKSGKIVHRQIGAIPEHDAELAAAIEKTLR